LKYKMVVIDVDGTLVDKNGNIAEEDKLAVAHLVASYVTVVLSTGRVIQATIPVINELGLKGFHIFYDGALVSNPQNLATSYSRPLEAEVVREAIGFTRQNNIYLELYSSEKFFAERHNWSDDIHRNFFHVEPEMVNFDDIWDKERLLKAEIVVHNDEEAMQAKSFKDNFGNSLNYSLAHSPAYPEVDFINIIHPEVSKGEALKKMMDSYGHLPSEVIAIGDGLNDISLLEAAGVSVAMGNAFDEVKQVADYITLDVEQHGVAAAVNFFFPV
jgi:Cof subfamily protein (haloacid dehalogenase superfamily)